MTAIDYDALRELADRATPGPWEVNVGDLDGDITVHHNQGVRASVAWFGMAPAPYSREDAAFIAAARTALPALLDENTALQARATRAEAERDEWRQTAQEERGATLDLLEVVKERDRRIEAVRGLMNHHDKFGNVPIEDLLRALNT